MSNKKSYSKPQIKKVKLIPEEAVLGGCKQAVGANKTAARCASAATCPNNAQLS